MEALGEESPGKKNTIRQAQQAWGRATWSQEWDEQGCGPSGSPNCPASQQLSLAWSQSRSSGLHPESVPQPGKEREGLGGHLPPGPPGWRCARPALPGPSGPWAAEPQSRSPSWRRPPWRTWLPPACLPWGPRAQPAPHLRPSSSPSPGCAPETGGLAPRAASGMKPGLLGLGPRAGVTLAASVDSSPPGSGCAWPPGTGPAARVLRSACRQPSGGSAVRTSAPGPAPPPPRPHPHPASPASGPLPRSRSGLLLQPLLQPAPLPLPQQPGLSPQINGLPNTPARQSSTQPASQTDGQRWRDWQSQEHRTHRRTRTDHKYTEAHAEGQEQGSRWE